MKKSNRLTLKQIVEIERLTNSQQALENDVRAREQSQLYQYLSQEIYKSPVTRLTKTS